MATTNFKNSAGADIGTGLVDRSYLMDRYPELANTYRFAGLWLWGGNSYGGLGNNSDVAHRSSPVQTIASGTNWKLVSNGCGYHTATIKTDNTLWTWGRNNFGQLGDNTITSRSSPVQTVSGTSSWKMLAGGTYHTATIKTDGTLWTWGRNNLGQLGDNTTTNQSSPVQTVAGGTNWKQVSCGKNSTAGIKTDGTLWLWGHNTYGQIGDNTLSFKSSPVQTIAAGTNWKSVANTYDFTAAIKTDGTLWTWGRNGRGQLGDNSSTNRQSPVQTVSGGTNWKQVVVAGLHMAAIKTDGTLWLWGSNNYGQLANNTSTNANNKSSPIQTIAGGTNWKMVACSSYNTACIKTDGTLWTWGYASPALGDNTTAAKSSPVQTVASGTNWKSVVAACGFPGSIAAIRDDSSDQI